MTTPRLRYMDLPGVDWEPSWAYQAGQEDFNYLSTQEPEIPAERRGDERFYGCPGTEREKQMRWLRNDSPLLYDRYTDGFEDARDHELRLEDESAA